MRAKKETTTPIPPAATGGEQSSMHKCSLSIAEKNADFKYHGIEELGVRKEKIEVSNLKRLFLLFY